MATATGPSTTTARFSQEHRTLAEAIANLVFTSLAIGFFNVLAIGIGVYSPGAEHAGYPPLLSQTFFDTYLPWFNVLWVLGLALNSVLLVTRRWTAILRLADLGILILTLGVFIRMVFGPSIINAGLEWIVAGSPWLQVDVALVSWLNWIMRGLIALVAFALSIAVIVRFVSFVAALVRRV